MVPPQQLLDPAFLGQHDPAIAIVSPTLLFIDDRVEITFTNTRRTAYWTVLDDGGRVVQSGQASTDGVAPTRVPLPGLPPGLYFFSASGSSDSMQRPRTTASFGVAAARAPTGTADAVGVAAHLDGSLSAPALADTAALLGVGNVRIDIEWRTVEKTKGTYTFPATYDDAISALTSRGVAALPIVDYANPFYDNGATPSSPAGITGYARFAAAVVDHYSPALHQIEIYNEFNSPTFNRGACGLTADCYVPLLRTASTAVRAVNPTMTVVGGSTSQVPLDWVRRFVTLGGLRSASAFSVHPYRLGKPPESIASDLGQVREAIDTGSTGPSKRLYVTELGWPTGRSPQSVSVDDQAAYLVRAAALTFAVGGTQFDWYNLVDVADDPGNIEANFGLFYAPRAGVAAPMPKPSALAMAAVSRMIGDRRPAGADVVPGLHSYRFGDGAAPTRVIWSVTPGRVEMTSSGAVTICTVSGACRDIDVAHGVTNLAVGPSPVFVTGATSVQAG